MPQEPLAFDSRQAAQRARHDAVGLFRATPLHMPRFRRPIDIADAQPPRREVTLTTFDYYASRHYCAMETRGCSSICDAYYGLFIDRCASRRGIAGVAFTRRRAMMPAMPSILDEVAARGARASTLMRRSPRLPPSNCGRDDRRQ